MTDQNIYLPIDQGEQAKQKNRNTLLARDVFQKIASLLKSSIAKINAAQCGELDDLDEHRAHEAILIDGGRGTGKSSVLVNLQLYMDGEEALKNDLLILKPVDPTLLENGDDLFLNIIVAALIRDKQIKNALNKGDKKAEQFYEQLQKLGNALEGVQTQREKHGLDKLRAFIGNHGIADEVHQLFKCSLELTGKKLIVLPIDDVDTSLQHAFENMEVVRKYLASPFVVPIISGDLDLYHDVTWRDFYGRIIKDHKIEENDAKSRSQSLANEYQRKVLPLPRRIHVPDINNYFNNNNIFLIGNNSKGSEFKLSLSFFKSWLDILLNERVNGFENSKLNLPTNSVRALSQLIYDVKKLIPDFSLVASEINSYDLLKNVVSDKLRNYTSAIKAGLDTNSSWIYALRKHYYNHEQGGAVFLVMDANIHWIEYSEADEAGSVLSAVLFSPLMHDQACFKHFWMVDGIKEAWFSHMGSRVSSISWHKNLPEKCILPYPLPENGVQGASILNKSKPIKSRAEFNGFEREEEFIRQLMVHQGFYSASKEGNLVLTGRLFELLILSLVQNVTVDLIENILARPPFYSASSFAITKDLILDQSDDYDISAGNNSDKYNDANLNLNNYIEHLVVEINDWRRQSDLVNFTKPHSWLIYNVMNKYFNQVSVQNSSIIKKNPSSKYLDMSYVVDVAIRSFNSICAAFGSFEKSSIFGMNGKISKNNVSYADADFEMNELFKQNIKPFLVGEKSNRNHIAIDGAYTGHLYLHPLKDILRVVFGHVKSLSAEPNIIEAHSRSSTQSLNSHFKILDAPIQSFLESKFPHSDSLAEIDKLSLTDKNKLKYEFEAGIASDQELSSKWHLLKDVGGLSPNSRSLIARFFNAVNPKNA